MIGNYGKRHQHSVGKFTLVYRVHIHYAMATILVACVLQSLQNSNKQLYQLDQSWFTSKANCVWVKLGIVRFGINAPSLCYVVFTGNGDCLLCSNHGSQFGYCALWHQCPITLVYSVYYCACWANTSHGSRDLVLRALASIPHHFLE